MTGVSDSHPKDPDWVAQTLLTAVTSGFSLVREPRLVRQRFEEELRVLVDARSVAVREYAHGAAIRPDVTTVDVPCAPGHIPSRLEVVFDASESVDDWKRRTLSVGAQIAALLV